MLKIIISTIVASILSIGGLFGLQGIKKENQKQLGTVSDPFLSLQLATNPSNGNCLTTDGTNNAWSSSCGSGGGGGGGVGWASTTADTNSIYFYGSGNVGIGTTSPSNKLEVAGNGYFSGNITGANITATGTAAVYTKATQDNPSSTYGLVVGGQSQIASMLLSPSSNRRWYVQANGGNLKLGDIVSGNAMVLGPGSSGVTFTGGMAMSSYSSFSLGTGAALSSFTGGGTGSQIFFAQSSLASTTNFLIGTASGSHPFAGSGGTGKFIIGGTNNTPTLPSGYNISGENAYLAIDGVTGNLGIGTTSPYAKLSVVGEVVAPYYTATSTTATSTFAGPIRATLSHTPASSSEVCVQGDITWDASYIYVCTATNTWARSTLATF